MAQVARLGVSSLMALLLALASGCVEPVGAAHIIGPDGTQMLHVHCGDEQVACFQLAGELCPRGYFLSPIFDPHDGNFLVRCKDPGQAVVASVAPAPAPTVVVARPTQGTATQTRAAESDWPPTEVAIPSEPWPAPSANAPPADVPASKTAAGAVDLGY